MESDRHLLSGNEAIARAARDLHYHFGSGYPGTPATEVLEVFDQLGGNARWAPNEKVACEVALGVAYARGRALCSMKHVGLNVAADVLYTAVQTHLTGALVIVVADDPGMASSQNEQDSRRYAYAAGCPMFEPADAQEAYDYMAAATELAEKWQMPVLLRMSTRICHAKSTVVTRTFPPAPQPAFEHDRQGRVMIPSNARPALRRLRSKLAEISRWNETGPYHGVEPGDGTNALGIIASGVAALHAREATPEACLLKLGLTYPPPVEAMREFAGQVSRCVVVEEGDPVLVEACRTAGIPVEDKPASYRFGELTVDRVRGILEGVVESDPAPPRGRPPRLCPGCPHGRVFERLRDLDLIVAGDIGCYSLGVLPPYEAMDTLVCMGAAVGVGLGMRHVLPPEERRRVVSVIGDSTFIHGGITGLVEMIYNPPPEGHVLIILDNATTAMTGLQEHPGTGRTLNHEPTGKVDFEALARSLGIDDVAVVDPIDEPERFDTTLDRFLESGRLCVLITQRPCGLALRRDRKLALERENRKGCGE